MLGTLGYDQVFQATSASQAQSVWSVESGRIGLVITDFVMPDETGDQMALRMRIQKPTVKILLISGNDPSSLHSAIPLEPNVNFLQKPFTLSDMRRWLQSLPQSA